MHYAASSDEQHDRQPDRQPDRQHDGPHDLFSIMIAIFDFAEIHLISVAVVCL